MLQNLPQELYCAILSEVPTSLLQSTTLNLSRAIPLSPVPLQFLFKSITITRPEQVLQLYRRLKFCSKDPALECSWIKSFTVLELNVDADVLVNTLVLCTSLHHLSLRIGPVFAPEHLEDLFRRPFHTLTSLDIRFIPYVKAATYYQFLKGSYFDSVFECLANWGTTELKHLSISQDPLPAKNPNEKAFAQPIVFFSFAPLKTLSVSLATEAVTHLRLSIPSRRLVPYLTGSDSSSLIFDTRSFPNVISLDLSSCAVHAADLPALINHVGKLRHLTLDYVHIFSGNIVEWEALGKAIALADVSLSREREKFLKAWADESSSTASHNLEGHIGPEVARHKRGRRGLATATISLRERPAENAFARPSFISYESIRQLGQFKIVPVVSHLQSLRICQQPSDMEDTMKSEFVKGWLDGLRVLKATWTRLFQSQVNSGVRLFRFDASAQRDSSLGSTGLIEIGRQGQDDFWNCLTSDSHSPPLVYFADTDGQNMPGGS